ncbi:MAG: hypothetical protein ACRC67_07195 [Inquilinus sp.]|uniref:hypothetical protein n=1 Tax=Inquilinus sp. TaxID=1932117 RepID=UPI003F2EF48A
MTWPSGTQATILIDTRDMAFPCLWLIHDTRQGEERETSYLVRLTTTVPPFGGLRWWFICPTTGRRTSKLYLPRGGERFLSRQAYQLGYASQRVGALDRGHLARQRILAKLGSTDGTRHELPAKPKGMRWATYDRLLVQLAKVEARIDATWAAGAQRLLARVTRH